MTTSPSSIHNPQPTIIMGVLQHKIWFDIWNNKNRTIQAVLTIAIGAFAVGLTLGASLLMNVGFQTAWQSTSPAMISLYVDPPVDDEMLTSIESIRGVKTVEGEMQYASIKWRPSPDENWQVAQLAARDDYKDMKLHLVELQNGMWPSRKTMGVEKAYGIGMADQVELEIKHQQDGTRVRLIEVTGILFDQLLMPEAYGGNPTFYTTREHFKEITGEDGFQFVRISAERFDEAEVTTLANKIQEHLKKQDVESKGAGDLFGNAITDPEQHPFHEIINGLNFVLVIMSILSLILGLILVFTTMTAIINQQINQIGIMKAIGAKNWQIFRTYISMVLVYGILALLIALPPSAVGAYYISSGSFVVMGLDPGPFEVSIPAILAQIVITLIAPLLTTIIPITTGARLTVREAISSYGLGNSSGLLERLIAASTLPGRLALMLSNTFRNKGRVALTIITLTGSGIIFMTVMSAQESLNYTYNDLLRSVYRFDATFTFEDTQRTKSVSNLTLDNPDVERVEMWEVQPATIRRAEQRQSNNDTQAIIFGVPFDSTMYQPELRAGRWFEPGDTQVVLLNQQLAEEIGISVGDWITFDHGVKGESDWQVIGLVFDALLKQSTVVPCDQLLYSTNSVNKANTVSLKFASHINSDEAAEQLRSLYDANQMKVSSTSAFYNVNTIDAVIEMVNHDISLIMGLLSSMAVIMAIVGSIALSGVLSINVLERTSEIGVMRAIGASSRAVATLFIGEGLTLGLISWLLAFPLSLPLSMLMSKTLGVILQSELTFAYAEVGVLFWLIIIVFLSTLASWLPARRAIGVSVRESLAYQ
ncbi:FtsX-like permease family protein [Anaerolineales bacterium HSG24]|nr:FtsX-like permease family protein [Anaerolineales bacterium HSG24]